VTDFLRENCDQIKTIVVKTKGTPTQKLLAILMLAGIEKTADLAAMTGLSERAVQTAKRNLLRETDCVAKPIAAQLIAETQPIALLAQPVSVARVEDNNIITNLETTVELITPPTPQAAPVAADAAVMPKAKRGSRLPEDWSLPDDWRQWTRVTYPHTTDDIVSNLADEFRDYWISVPGQRGLKANWEATWRNRCRDKLSTAPVRPHAHPPRQGSSWEAEKAAKYARIRALMEPVGGTA